MVFELEKIKNKNIMIYVSTFKRSIGDITPLFLSEKL
jgi:hypothetical protein